MTPDKIIESLKNIPYLDSDCALPPELQEAAKAAADYIARNEAAHDRVAPNWRKPEDHGPDYRDGETMLVAVAVRCSGDDSTVHYELSIITVVGYEDGMEIECDGNEWGWDWDCVEYWVPIEEVIGAIPKEAEETL